jgi:HPt (histidine-containing phosphotransfer) domain-containing protein
MQALRESFDQREFGVLSNCAHALKSAAHYVGALELSEVAAQLEVLSPAGNTDALAPLLSAAEAAYEKLRVAAPAPSLASISS